MAEVYDLAIIGTGPAGVSAALTAKARNLNFIWFGSKELSTKIEKAEKISNYPGLSGVSGLEMKDAFTKQIEDEEIEITPKTINQIFTMGKQYALFANQESFQAKTLIFAMGMTAGTTIKGEAEYLGKGVSYCATCDGRLYKGKKIAVICTNKEYEEEIEFLADLAETVHVFSSYKDFGVERENIVMHSGMPKEVLGEQTVKGVVLKDASENDGNELLEVAGVFCLRDNYSPAALLQNLEYEGNHIKVDRALQTNLSGCFAAGDITGRPYQYAKAVGEGNVAVHSAIDYLHEN